MRALPLLDLRDRDSVYFAARTTLCARKSDLWPFDLAFRQFWGRNRQLVLPSDTGALPEPPANPPLRLHTPPGEKQPRIPQTLPAKERVTLVDIGGDGEEGVAGDLTEDRRLERALRYSPEERLHHLDFARFSEEELAAARAIMGGWRWRLAQRRTRRMAAAKRGPRLDILRTLRRAMRTEGVPYTLARKGPRRRARPLVLLCDISGSMASYTRVLLYFMHTIRREVGNVEVFVFGTRLTRVTRQLRARDVDQALAEVGRMVVDWAGGTRMGETLHTFNTHWARRVLGQGAIVCIISDGWDRGDPALLAAEMAHLQRLAFRLIWLNPLMGFQGYQPLARGIATALRYVDHLLPAHDLASLQALAHLLGSLDANARPARRQGAMSGTAVGPPAG
ncbi:MAG: VWA domain-containing protein [Candidatus Dormibacteraeota bacterium]|nr:VWA domain-containing protein [Candidatus Dormibacteraeota bacterium]